MAKIILEREKCIGCGSCVSLCDKYFELADDGKVHLKNFSSSNGNEELEVEKLDCAQEAVDVCPVQCIHIIR